MTENEKKNRKTNKRWRAKEKQKMACATRMHTQHWYRGKICSFYKAKWVYGDRRYSLSVGLFLNGRKTRDRKCHEKIEGESVVEPALIIFREKDNQPELVFVFFFALVFCLSFFFFRLIFYSQ